MKQNKFFLQMRFPITAAAIAALVPSLVAAQSQDVIFTTITNVITKQPDCSQNCVTKSTNGLSIKNLTMAAITNVCANIPTITTSFNTCVTSDCKGGDLVQALTVVRYIWYIVLLDWIT
jgi:hypothetical protein